MELDGNLVWLKVNAATGEILDVLTGQTPRAWRGTHVTFRVGIYYDTDILDLANVASLTLSVFAASRTGDKQMNLTVAAADFNATTFTAEDWAGRSDYHAEFAFVGDLTNLAVGTSTRLAYWLAVAGLTTHTPAHKLTYGGGAFTIEEDGPYNSDLTTPAPADTFYTGDESDARFAPRFADGAWVRFHQNRWWHYIQSEDLWYPELAELKDGIPVLTLGSGESL